MFRKFVLAGAVSAVAVMAILPSTLTAAAQSTEPSKPAASADTKGTITTKGESPVPQGKSISAKKTKKKKKM